MQLQIIIKKGIKTDLHFIVSEFPTNSSELTLTSGNGRVPRVVAQRRTSAHCCGVAYETVTAVARPAHHAVDVTAALRGDGAMERRVRRGAVQCCHRVNHIDTKFNKVASHCPGTGRNTRLNTIIHDKNIITPHIRRSQPRVLVN